MPCRATQDGWVMVESSDKMWSTGEGKGKPLQYSCFDNPMNSMKRQKDKTLKDELPRSVGTQYATGDQQRNKSRKNENNNHRRLSKLITWITALSNSVKLWAMPCRATHDGRSWWRVTIKHGPLEKGMANHFRILALRTPWTIGKGKKVWVTEQQQRWELR